MNVLAINGGSSSIKWGVFTVRAGGGRGTVARRWAHGRIERIGGEATLHFEAAGAAPLDTTAHVPDHDDGYRIRKYVGAYLAALGGAQAVVFTGAIGERSSEVRARVCQGLEWLGLTLDPGANAAAIEGERRISAAGARLEAFVIPTHEEIEIARGTVDALHLARAGESAGLPEGDDVDHDPRTQDTGSGGAREGNPRRQR